MTCVFCKIAKGEIPSHRVLENEHAFAFLDIQPLARGHTLVIPRRHAERVEDLPREDLVGMMELAQRVSRRITQGLPAEGVTWGINNGRAAGQEVMHAHLHLVPRREGDGFGPIHRLFDKRPELREGELQELAMRLRG